MMGLRGPVKRFVEIFARIPSIGPRQAMRLAFHLIALGPAGMKEAREAIAVLETLAPCPRCFSVYQRTSEAPLCAVCGDTERDQETIAIVEKETDILSLENARAYAGRYFILGSDRATGAINGMRGERLAQLKRHIVEAYGGKAKEIVVALSPTSYGDIAITTLVQELQPFAARVSRLGRGIPMGGDVEFADEDTLREALQGRR
jgi:recombination protein RecR